MRRGERLLEVAAVGQLQRPAGAQRIAEQVAVGLDGEQAGVLGVP
jgi:hypothetical protein